MVASAPQVVPLLFGAGFEGSVAPLQILMAGSIALSVSAVLVNALRGLGHPLEPAPAELAGAIATLLRCRCSLPARDRPRRDRLDAQVHDRRRDHGMEVEACPVVTASRLSLI